MFKQITDRNIWAIYLSTLVLGVADGIAIAGIGVFLDEQGFDKGEIGILATSFAMGIVLFSIPMGGFVKRFSGKRVLLVSTLTYGLAVAIFPLVSSTFAGVAAIRFIDGAASAGVWVSSETILLARARREVKAMVMSLYTIAIAIGYIIGPIASNIIVSLSSLSITYYASGLVAVIAGLITLFGLERLDPEEMARAHDGEPGEGDGEETPVMLLLKKIKNSCFAAYAYGYFQASVVLFIPLWLTDARGVATEDTLLVTAYFAAGMFIFASLVARLGDRFGHLKMMRILAFIGTCFLITLPSVYTYWLICVFIFVAGATFATLSPVSLALQGISVEPKDYPRSNSIYNAFYALGMLTGPPMSGFLFVKYSGDVMFYHLAALWGCFVIFSILFRKDDPATQRRAPLPAPVPA